MSMFNIQLVIGNIITLATIKVNFRVARGGGDLVNCVLLEEGIASGRAAERVFRRPAAAEDDMKTAILSHEMSEGRNCAPCGV